MFLYLKPSDPSNSDLVTSFYSNHGTYHYGDSGIDCFFLREFTVPAKAQGFPLPLGICGSMYTDSVNPAPLYRNSVLSAPIPGQSNTPKPAIPKFEDACEPVGYWLLPRSSISKTPLRMSNSVGLVDSGYTGELMAVVDNVSDIDYTISAGTRLFQIASATLVPIQFALVSDLRVTTRGSGGFGSTRGFRAPTADCG
jgi:dUTP pyrophosphatase